MAENIIKSIATSKGSAKYDYESLVNKPNIPTKTSDLTNDSNYITSEALNNVAPKEHQHNYAPLVGGASIVGWYTFEDGGVNAQFVQVSGEDVATKSEIPTKTSDLTNDSGFLTEHQDLSEYIKKQDTIINYEFRAGGLNELFYNAFIYLVNKFRNQEIDSSKYILFNTKYLININPTKPNYYILEVVDLINNIEYKYRGSEEDGYAGYDYTTATAGDFNIENAQIISYQPKLTAGEGITIDENNVISSTGGSSNVLSIGNGNDYRTTIYDLLMLYKNGEITNGTYILSYKWLADITSTYSPTAINVDIYGLMPLESVDFSNDNNSTKRYNCMQDISNDFTSDELVINETKYYYTKEEVDELIDSSGSSKNHLTIDVYGPIDTRISLVMYEMFNKFINNEIVEDETYIINNEYKAIIIQGGDMSSPYTSVSVSEEYEGSYNKSYEYILSNLSDFSTLDKHNISFNSYTNYYTADEIDELIGGSSQNNAVTKDEDGNITMSSFTGLKSDSDGVNTGFGFNDSGDPVIVGSGYRGLYIASDGFDGNGLKYTFPERGGEVALLEDVPIKTSELQNDSNFVTTNDLFSKNYNDLTNKPTTMKNPESITFTGAVTGTYDGSSALTVNIPEASNNTQVIGTVLFSGVATSNTMELNSNIDISKYSSLSVTVKDPNNGYYTAILDPQELVSGHNQNYGFYKDSGNSQVAGYVGNFYYYLNGSKKMFGVSARDFYIKHEQNNWITQNEGNALRIVRIVGIGDTPVSA